MASMNKKEVEKLLDKCSVSKMIVPSYSFYNRRKYAVTKG